jgi:8-oxo-dGTP diphosphatase
MVIKNMNKKFKAIFFILLILFGIFLFFYGEYDDSPGAQGLGVLLIISGIVAVIRIVTFFKNKDDKKYPKVGIGIMIQNHNGLVLLGLRKGSHGAGEWSFPGGHLEMGETIFTTATREVKEETGLDITKFEVISVADELRYFKSDGKHYLNIGLRGIYNDGEPTVMEPDKCEKWQWFELNNLPNNLFEGTELTINNFKRNKLY